MKHELDVVVFISKVVCTIFDQVETAYTYVRAILLSIIFQREIVHSVVPQIIFLLVGLQMD